MVKQLMRADAQRSYDRILEAADRVVALDGASASLEEIARQAGVGSATLHRHFRSRWDLLDALFADRVDKLCAEATHTVETRPAGAALTDWMRRLTVESARNRGLAASMMRRRTQSPAAENSCAAKIHDTGALLMTNAVSAGAIRSDASISDLLRLVSAIVISTDGSADAAAESLTLIDLVLDGIYPSTQRSAT